MDYNEWLAHFNPNHDPKNGQFTSNAGGSSLSKAGSTKSSSSAVNTKSANESSSDGDEQSKSSNHNVDWKKAAVVGGVAVTGTLAAIGGYKLYKSGVLDDYIKKGKDAIEDIPVNRLGKRYDELDMKMIKSINAEGPITHDRQINCTHTTTAYVLNSLYDKHVIAKPFGGYDEIYDQIGEGRDMRIFDDVFEGIKTHDYVGDPTNPKDTAKFLFSRGHWNERLNEIQPGSTGILWIASPLGASHVINYEKTKDGVVTLIDCQSKKVYKNGLSQALFKFNGMWKIARSMDFSEATIREDAPRILGTMVERDPDYKFSTSDFEKVLTKAS